MSIFRFDLIFGLLFCDLLFYIIYQIRCVLQLINTFYPIDSGESYKYSDNIVSSFRNNFTEEFILETEELLGNALILDFGKPGAARRMINQVVSKNSFCILVT